MWTWFPVQKKWDSSVWQKERFTGLFDFIPSHPIPYGEICQSGMRSNPMSRIQEVPYGNIFTIPARTSPYA